MCLLRPSGPRSITRKHYTFYQKRKFGCFGRISDQTAIISLYNVYRLVNWESIFPSNPPTFPKDHFCFFLWKVPKSSLVCSSGVSNVNMEMSVELWWNDIDRVQPKSEKNLSQCHFFHQRSHVDRPEIEPEPPRWETSIKKCSPRGRNWVKYNSG
jgi:hypothetical protein